MKKNFERLKQRFLTYIEGGKKSKKREKKM